MFTLPKTHTCNTQAVKFFIISDAAVFWDVTQRRFWDITQRRCHATSLRDMLKNGCKGDYIHVPLMMTLRILLARWGWDFNSF